VQLMAQRLMELDVEGTLRRRATTGRKPSGSGVSEFLR
jgi:hypothetical protein